MVNYSRSSSAAALDATFSALADPTRRAILAHLARRPDARVGDLGRPFAMSAPAISRHLRVLEGAGLLARRREGRVHHCRFVPGPMRSAADWIEHYRAFWEDRLDALARFLDETAGDEAPKEEAKPWSPPHRRRSASRGRSARRATGSTAPGRTRSS